VEWSRVEELSKVEGEGEETKRWCRRGKGREEAGSRKRKKKRDFQTQRSERR
jgi:hypothetical protein